MASQWQVDQRTDWELKPRYVLWAVQDRLNHALTSSLQVLKVGILIVSFTKSELVKLIAQTTSHYRRHHRIHDFLQKETINTEQTKRNSIILRIVVLNPLTNCLATNVTYFKVRPRKHMHVYTQQCHINISVSQPLPSSIFALPLDQTKTINKIRTRRKDERKKKEERSALRTFFACKLYDNVAKQACFSPFQLRTQQIEYTVKHFEEWGCVYLQW